MTAGGSAAEEAQRSRLLAEAHERAAREQRQRAGRFAVAERSEVSTARTLAPLAAMGYLQLADRRWPGTRKANVDLLLLGPSGVYVIDTKAWAEPAIIGGRLFRGQEDVTDQVDGLLRIVDLAESDFCEVGLAPCEVVPVIALAGRQGVRETVGRVHVIGEKDLLAFVVQRGTRLTEPQVDAVTQRAMALFPPMSSAPTPVVAAVPEPVLPAPRRPEAEELALLSAADVKAAVVEAAMAKPIEEWMTFLHPEQARLVRRSWNGPARVRGAAGTGKTVVGLHRAAYLATTRPGRILYTSYVRTLPLVLEQLYARLAPATVDRVDFVNIHRFALDLLRDRGIEPRLDIAKADKAYRIAWSKVGKSGVLKQVPQEWTYWSDEIQYVIKGRGITSFGAYASLDRVGRRYPLTTDQRPAVWDLFCAYEEALTELGVRDLADVVLMAEQHVRENPLQPGYSAVVVDEVQDLSCASVRLLHALVGDSPDGLLLIGDGQQSVYPGGFTLLEAGVSVTGRASVLRCNYRNTEQILAAANNVVSRDRFSDLDGLDELGERDVECVRTGPSPVRVAATDLSSHDTALLTAIERATRGVGVSHGDVAVLAARRATVKHYLAVLAAAGVPVVDLERYDGRTDERVKVGTFKRAKGLEFKHVLLPQLVDGPSTRWTDESNSAYRERVELDRRELFVGMTRARDGLWLGYVRGR